MPAFATLILNPSTHASAARSDVGRRYVTAAVQTGIGGIVSRVLQGFAPIILARYLGPKEYGVYVLVLSLVGIVAGASPLGQDTALEKFLPEYSVKNPARGGAILANTVILFSGVLVILCAAFFFTANWLASAVYHDASLARVFQFSALLVLTLSLFNLAYSVSAGLQDFTNYSRAMIVRSGALTLFGWLGVLFLGLYGALLAQLAASLLGLSLLTITAVKLSRRRFPGLLRPQFSKDLLQKTFGLAFPAFLTGLLVAPAYWWANTLLARESGFADVAIFGVAFSLTQMIMLVPSNLSIPAVSFLSEAHSSGNLQRFGGLVGDNFRLMWAITLPIAAGCAVLSTPVILLLFGAQYERAGDLVVAMSFAGILMILNSVVINATFGSGYLWHGFLINLSWLILFLVIGYLLIPAWGAMGLACTFVLSFTPLAMGAAVYAARGLGAQFKKIAVLLTMTVIAFGAAIALHRAVHGTPLLAMGCMMILLLVVSEWIWVCDERERAEVRNRCFGLRLRQLPPFQNRDAARWRV
jgi:O-antigen/teichoic acid export membrane protein